MEFFIADAILDYVFLRASTLSPPMKVEAILKDKEQDVKDIPLGNGYISATTGGMFYSFMKKIDWPLPQTVNNPVFRALVWNNHSTVAPTCKLGVIYHFEEQP